METYSCDRRRLQTRLFFFTVLLHASVALRLFGNS